MSGWDGVYCVRCRREAAKATDPDRLTKLAAHAACCGGVRR
jgi:hypothetical protein